MGKDQHERKSRRRIDAEEKERAGVQRGGGAAFDREEDKVDKEEEKY